MAALLQDTNGSAVYSNEKALFGYLATDLHLILPADIVTDICKQQAQTDVPKKRITLETLGKATGLEHYLSGDAEKYRKEVGYLPLSDGVKTLKVAAMNYIKLTTAGASGDFKINDQTSIFISLLRARWVSLGCLFTDKSTEINDKTRTQSEVIVVKAKPTGDIYERIAAASSVKEIFTAMGTAATPFSLGCKSETHGMNLAVKLAEAIWCTSEYLFRTRGHHFKDSYVEPIKKVMRAAFEGNLHLPDNAEWNHIFHTAIHPFGVMALPIMAAHFMIHGVVGNALMLRMGAAPNGVAAITTSKAVIDVIATESWYPKFAGNFAEQLTLCSKLAEVIMDDKYSYSLAAGLYGLTRKTTVTIDGKKYSVEAGKGHVAGIATVGQGLINALTAQKANGTIEGFSFENAQALAKMARANPLLAAKVASIVGLSLDLLAQAKTMDEAASMVFPSVGPTVAPPAAP